MEGWWRQLDCILEEKMATRSVSLWLTSHVHDIRHVRTALSIHMHACPLCSNRASQVPTKANSCFQDTSKYRCGMLSCQTVYPAYLTNRVKPVHRPASMQVTDEFCQGLSEYIDDPVRFRMSLMPTKIQEGANVMYANLTAPSL